MSRVAALRSVASVSCRASLGCRRWLIPRSALPQISRGQPFSTSSSTAPGHLAQMTPAAPSSSSWLLEADPNLASWWKRRRQDTSAKSGKLPPSLIARLSTELEAFTAELQPDPAHVDQLKSFLKSLQVQLESVADDVKVHPFGSAVNGFWTATSDVDVCIKVPRASTAPGQVRILRDISAHLRKVDLKYTIEPRFGAKVPILHLAPRIPGMVSVDISVNNTLAVVNSRLLGAYVKFDERLRILGFCVKAWAATRGINDRSRGTLSSFSLILMLIHFLQRRSPPILPSLQDLAFSLNLPPKYVNGVDCRYCVDASEIESEMKHLQGQGPPNGESVGLLLAEFFRYFAHEYRHGIIRIRDTRSQLPPGDESGQYFVIDNPFEVGKDVANIDHSQHELIRKEFRRSWAFLKDGRSFQDLLRNSALPDPFGHQLKKKNTGGGDVASQRLKWIAK